MKVKWRLPCLLFIVAVHFGLQNSCVSCEDGGRADDVSTGLDEALINTILTEISDLKITQGAMQVEMDDLKQAVRVLQSENIEKDKTINDLLNRCASTVPDTMDTGTDFEVQTTLDVIKGNQSGDISENNQTDGGTMQSIRAYKKAISQRPLTAIRLKLSNTEPEKQRARRAPTTVPSTPTKVAFSAYLDHAIVQLGTGEAIPFNEIWYNEGNAYNHYTGIFTAPVSGIYLFSWSCAAMTKPHVPAYDIFTTLVINDVKKSTAVAESREDYIEDQGSNTYIGPVNAGDVVWIKHTGGIAIHSTPEGIMTTFSGVLLFSS